MVDFDINTTGEEVVEVFRSQIVGKTIVVTGPSQGGIGAQIAITIAKAGPAHILLLGRDRSKILPVVQAIQTDSPKVKVSYVHCDLADNASVRRAAAEVNKTVDMIDILFNNAAIMASRPYQVSKDGVELQFATGYLGHFLLTNLVVPKLIAASGIVINMTSTTYMLDQVNLEDINFGDGKTYCPWRAYARTKTANILFTYGLMKTFCEVGVSSLAVHPGHVEGTNILSSSGVDADLIQEGWQLGTARNDGKPMTMPTWVSLQQGCATPLLAALDPSIRAQAPAYLEDCAVVRALPYATDVLIVNDLWDKSAELVGGFLPAELEE